MSSLRSYRIVLKQTTPFSGVIDSIKIYGALAHAMADLYGEVNSFFKALNEGLIRTSSPMPLVNNKYYFFKPNLPLREKVDYLYFKRFKKAKFLSEDVVMKVLKDGFYDQSSAATVTCEDIPFFKQEDMPGVFVNRVMGESKIYYKDTLVYSDRLWILLQVDEYWKRKVLSALRFLGDVGISKKHTSGFGRFEIEKYEEVNLRNVGEYRLILSKYIPNKDEIKKFPFEQAHYDIKKISGYTKFGESIPPVRAIAEGSTYPTGRFEGIPRGRVLNLTNRYSIVGVPVVI